MRFWPDEMLAVEINQHEQCELFMQNNGPRPGQIDNSKLVKSSDKYIPSDVPVLKKGLKFDVDYKLVTANQWQLIQNEFGGGPTIRLAKILGNYPEVSFIQDQNKIKLLVLREPVDQL